MTNCYANAIPDINIMIYTCVEFYMINNNIHWAENLPEVRVCP